MSKIERAKKQPILIDACILMVGVKKQISDKRYSFENMKIQYLDAIFNYFEDIKIHEEVYKELDEDRRILVDEHIGKNVEIVTEGNMYNEDPIYNSIFNKIKDHDLVNFQRWQSKNRGEIFSLAYAAYHGINYFTTKDYLVSIIVEDLPDLQGIELIGIEDILVVAYINTKDSDIKKGLKSLYKSQCETLIEQKKIPETLIEYISTFDTE